MFQINLVIASNTSVNGDISQLIQAQVEYSQLAASVFMYPPLWGITSNQLWTVDTSYPLPWMRLAEQLQTLTVKQLQPG